MAVMAKKRGPRGAGRQGVPMTVYLPPALRDALGEYLQSLRPEPSITAVVQVAMEDFLRAKGFLRDEDEGEE